MLDEEKGPAAKSVNVTVVEDVEEASQVEVEVNVVVVVVVEGGDAGEDLPFSSSLALGPEEEELDEEAKSVSCSPSTVTSSLVCPSCGSNQTP